MGKPINSSGTQAKERARQQKQSDKELKRMLTRQKTAYVKTCPPNIHTDITEPILTAEIFESKDLPIHLSARS